ncbi:MAG TPA: hypothetical protein VFS93_00840 [Terrimesophilobacter sp.]|nr:hypothetical protein [Terrimesophilobacter sp.]
MPTTLDQETIAEALPGSWRVGATNIVDWLDGDRRDPVFRFEVSETTPLAISEEQEFTSPEGKSRLITIQSEWVDGVFRSKGRGILKSGASRWRLGGMSEDRSVLVIRVATIRGGQDGLLVLVRSDAASGELRSMIATRSDEFGLGPEDFASLSWLDLSASGGF